MPLDISGSCHPLKAAAFRQAQRLLRSPVGLSVLTRMTPSLRSVGITPPHRYYGGVRPSAPHRYSRLAVFAACASPFTSERLVPAVPRESLHPLHALCTPAAVCPVIRHPTNSSQGRRLTLVSAASNLFDASSRVHLHSSLGCPPAQFSLRAFDPTLTTTPFERSSLDWFETCP